MRTESARGSWLALALAFVGPLAAQRSPFFARVTGPDGDVLVNAEVTCVEVGSDAARSPDVVTATTDARGQARCSLLVGRVYVAWAIGAPVDGWSCVTAPTPLIAAGRVVELGAFERDRARRLNVRHAAEWREVGAVGARWYPHGALQCGVDVALALDGSVVVPASPNVEGCLTLVDRDGQDLVGHDVDPGSLEPVRLQPPVSVSVRALDEEGRPVAGVEITSPVPDLSVETRVCGAASSKPFVRRVGETGADGRLQLHLPMSRDRFLGGRIDPRILLADRQGYRFDARVLEATRESDEVTMHMDPAAETRFEVFGGDVEVSGLFAVGTKRLPVSRGAMLGRHALRVTGSGSRWLVRGARDGMSAQLWVEAARPTIVLNDRVEGVPDTVRIDLDGMRRCRLRIRDPDGGPVPCAIGVGRRGYSSPWARAVLASDLSGAADILFGPGEFFVYATTGRSHGLFLLGQETPGDHELRLQRIPLTIVRVVDDRGEPVVGARLQFMGARGARLFDVQTDDEQLSLVSPIIAGESVQAVRSDAAGLMRIPTSCRDFPVQVRVLVDSRTSGSFYLDPDAGELRVVVR